MHRTLQPIVALRQQLIVGGSCRTIQPVVVSKENAREGFARRLNEALNDMSGCPGSSERGRIAWVAKRYGVSNEAAAKWLDGRVIPGQANLARIASDLNVTPQWLHAEQQPKRPLRDDAVSIEMREIWDMLPPPERGAVRDFARFKAGLPPKEDNPRGPLDAEQRRAAG